MKKNTIALTIGVLLACFASSVVSAILCSHIIRDKIKPDNSSYEDVSEQWYDQLTYLGYNSFFNEHQYYILWEEGDSKFWKTVETEMGPSEFVIYAQSSKKDFIGKGFAK